MKTLNDIFLDTAADKASKHHVKGHDYARFYDAAFTPLRNADIKVVEIGVGSAESIKGWLNYFPNAQVFGLDIVHDTNPWNTPGAKPHPRYTYSYIDQSVEHEWKKFVEEYGANWDILVDDGGHSNQQIVTTFKMMWPHIKPGGYYAIEDLSCAYSGMEFFLKPGFPNHMDWIKAMLDQINRGESGIDEMRCSQELCIVRKKS